MVGSMTAAHQHADAPALASRHAPSTLLAGLLAFALVQLALSLFMAAAPHGFFTAVGPYGTYNGHYIRDVSTFYAAIGACLLVAVRVPSWRAPVLAVTTIQYALHSLNHLLDIARAHPAWTGYFNFFSLAAATVLLGWLWRAAASEGSP
jgi:hypothetical protein